MHVFLKHITTIQTHIKTVFYVEYNTCLLFVFVVHEYVCFTRIYNFLNNYYHIGVRDANF